MSVYLGLHHPHAPPVLDHTQHVDRLRSFESSLRETRELAKKVASKRDHAYLLEHRMTLDACEVERGDWSPRKVKGVPVDIHHDLDGVAINVFFPADNPARQVHTFHGWIPDQGRHGGGDHSWRNHRLVPLNHHDYIGFESFRPPPHPIPSPFTATPPPTTL